MSSAGRIILRNNIMNRKSDDSEDEYDEYKQARKCIRSLDKKIMKDTRQKPMGRRVG